jgi:DNA-directed RNA polymerase specialized sigma24 family protein
MCLGTTSTLETTMIQNPYDLLSIAYRAANRVVQNPVLAEEASERAVHQLTLIMLKGCPPDEPAAWLRCVAKRSACALLRSDWARTRTMDVGDAPSPPPREPKAPAGGTTWVRERLLPTLTSRQQEALDAAIHCNTTRAAARTCQMQPRDFRRSLSSIGRNARKLLAMDPDALVDLAVPHGEAL